MSGFVGIDVAAKTFDVVVRIDGKANKVEQFSQTPDGHAAVVRKLQKLAPELVVMEATGIYYLDLAVTLTRANLPVSVINPKSFHHFAAMKLNGNKTDAVDAALLAEFAQCMSPRLWNAPQDELLGLRDIGRQLNRLTASRTQAKNRLHALTSKSMTLPMLIEDEQDGIEQLERRIKRLTQAALALITGNATLAALDSGKVSFDLENLEAEHVMLTQRLEQFGDCRDAKEIWQRLSLPSAEELALMPADEFVRATDSARNVARGVQ